MIHIVLPAYTVRITRMVPEIPTTSRKGSAVALLGNADIHGIMPMINVGQIVR